MNDTKQSQALDKARGCLDDSVDTMPAELSARLAQVRSQAMSSSTVDQPSGRPFFIKNQWIWSGAIAASCVALAITFGLRQPGPDSMELLQPETEESLLLLADMDETDWQLVQELEFALWLSEYGDD